MYRILQFYQSWIVVPTLGVQLDDPFSEGSWPPSCPHCHSDSVVEIVDPQYSRDNFGRESSSTHRIDGLGLAQVPITTGLRPSGLQGLAERLSGHEQRLTSTGLLLQRLEQQLQDELAEANHLAETQRRSAILANRRTAVPQCEIERFPTATTSQCAGQVCCICDDDFKLKSCKVQDSEAEAKDIGNGTENSDEAKDPGEAKEHEAKETEARLGISKLDQRDAGEVDDELATCALPACGHVFHRHCIGRWLRLKNTCPMCRAALPTVPKLSELVDLGTDELRRRLDHWKINHSDVLPAFDSKSSGIMGLETASVDTVSDPITVQKVPQKVTEETKILADRLYAHLSARPKGEEAEEGDDDYVAPASEVQASNANEEEGSEGYSSRNNRESEEAVAAIARSISSAMDRRAQRRRLWELERHAAELELAQRMMHYQEVTRPLGMMESEEQQRREAVAEVLHRHESNEVEEVAQAMEQRHTRESARVEVLRRETDAMSAEDDTVRLVNTSSVYPSSSSSSSSQGGAPRGLYAYAHSSIDHSALRSSPLTSFEPRERFGGALSRTYPATTIPERSAELQQALRDIGEDPEAPILFLHDEQQHGEGLLAAASADDGDSRQSDALLDPRAFDLLEPRPRPSDEIVGSRDYVVNANPNGTHTITGFRVDGH